MSVAYTLSVGILTHSYIQNLSPGEWAAILYAEDKPFYPPENLWLFYDATGNMLSAGGQGDQEWSLQALLPFDELFQLMPESALSLHCYNGYKALYQLPFF